MPTSLYRWFQVATATFALLASIAAPSRALTEDDENVWGLRRLRREVVEGLRNGDADEIGPWTLRYTGPHERGTVVWVTMQPDEAFETKRVDRDEFLVRLVKPKRLLTKITGDLRPIGVKILKTLEEPGEGRVYVTFQNKEGQDLDLERLKGLEMIRGLKWSNSGAAEFLGYSGAEAGFRRLPGHENTSVEVLITIREEGHDYIYSAWLPRLGDSLPIDPRRCREERVYDGSRVVALRTPWKRVGRRNTEANAREDAQVEVWDEMRAHCEQRLGGELVLDSIRIREDCANRESCVITRTCGCAAAATYQCKLRQYRTVEICN